VALIVPQDQRRDVVTLAGAEPVEQFVSETRRSTAIADGR
jgi:hypothetical protein